MEDEPGVGQYIIIFILLVYYLYSSWIVIGPFH